jgi:hypothetical protein
VILVDMGSTHNFMSIDVARRLGMPLKAVECFEVAVANGERIRSEGRCNGVQVCLNKAEFVIEFFLIPMEGCEVVLGAQWLQVLGPILWDFSKLNMKFMWKGNEVELWGLTVPRNKFVDSKGIVQGVQNQQLGFILFSINLSTSQGALSSNNPDLHKILDNFSEIFVESQGLPPRRRHDHRIPLKPKMGPVSACPYQYPHYQKNEIEKIVSCLLETGVIRPSISAYSSPALLVKKHDGSWRMCANYRALNNITIKDKFPIPVIDELLDELHGAKFFSKLDLRSGYHQIRMYVGEVEKTAFRTHQGHYEFLVMPFGLINAPSTFQALMNDIFSNFLRKFVLVFFFMTY